MATKGNILIVDDEKDIRFLLREILEDEGYAVAEAPHSEAAYAEIATKGMPDLVILDIWLENSDRDGMEILGDLKKRSQNLPVLMISGHGNIEMAVKAIKLGAYDFIEKPFNTDRLLHLVTRAFESGRKRSQAVAGEVSVTAISPDMQATLKAAQKAAHGDARVLITGAWGVGRTHLARYIHQESVRAAKPCVCLPCGMLDASALLEALGQEATVVLRDVHLLSTDLQTDLLAKLKGKCEARVIATATPVIDGARKSGVFSPDLYERLAVNVITVPSLEDRRADIPDLCLKLISDCFAAWGVTDIPTMSTEAATYLRQQNFAGQAAALEAQCTLAAMAMMQAGKTEITSAYFAAGSPEGSADTPVDAWLSQDLRSAREDFERWYFDKLMARFDGNVSQVAAFAGMDRTALHRKLKALKGDNDAEAAA